MTSTRKDPDIARWFLRLLSGSSPRSPRRLCERGMINGSSACVNQNGPAYPAVAHMIANCLPKPDPPPKMNTKVSCRKTGTLVPVMTNL